MQCNIDAKGKRVRLIGGFVWLLIGIVVLGLALTAVFTSTWAWIIAGVLILAGAFQIFEARAGWCALRAMGFKTPV